MIVTLTGPNDFMRQAALQELVDNFVTTYGEFGLEHLDGEEVEYQRLYDAVTSLPFLVERKMVVLRSPSANKTFMESAEGLLTGSADSIDVVLVEPKLDKRTAYYKLLKKITDFRDYGLLDGIGLSKWMMGYVKEHHGTLGSAEARLLIDRAGSNQALLKNELDKLLLYNPTITKDSIMALIEQAPQSTIFELLDAAFAGNHRKALQLYEEQRALKVEPQQIIAMLVWQLHVLALIKTAGTRSPEAIAKEAKLSPFVVRKSVSIARKLTLMELKTLLQDALRLDVRLKSEAIDADEALQFFLLQIG